MYSSTTPGGWPRILMRVVLRNVVMPKSRPIEPCAMQPLGKSGQQRGETMSAAEKKRH